MLISHQFPHIYSPNSVFTLHKIITRWTVPPEDGGEEIQEWRTGPSVTSICEEKETWGGGVNWLEERGRRTLPKTLTRHLPWSISLGEISERARKQVRESAARSKTNVKCQKSRLNKRGGGKKFNLMYNKRIGVARCSFYHGAGK